MTLVLLFRLNLEDGDKRILVWIFVTHVLSSLLKFFNMFASMHHQSIFNILKVIATSVKLAIVCCILQEKFKEEISWNSLEENILAFYVWLIIELAFYFGFVLFSMGFLFMRTLKIGDIFFPVLTEFSATSDFLEASTYHLDIVLSFAAPLVVSSCLLILNQNLNNGCVPTAEANT